MKRKKRIKNINIFALNIGIDKWMRNHPLYGPSYVRHKNIEELFKPKERKFR